MFGEWLSGIALAWGARGPEFDSRLPDHFFSSYLLFFYNLRGVAQLVARMVRDHEVAGSNPVAPIFILYKKLGRSRQTALPAARFEARSDVFV